MFEIHNQRSRNTKCVRYISMFIFGVLESTEYYKYHIRTLPNYLSQ